MVDGQLAAMILRLARILILAVAALSAAESQADTRDEVRAFMQGYLQSFDSGYSRDIAAHYHAPMYMLAPNGNLQEFETTKQIQQTIKKWKRYLFQYGFDHTTWVALNVKPLSNSTALVSTVFDRITSSGTLLHRGAATYTVHRENGNWKIFLIHLHDSKNVLEFD